MKPVDSEPHFPSLGSDLRLEENEGTLTGHSLEACCPCAAHLTTIRQEDKINAVMGLHSSAPEPALALLFHRGLWRALHATCQIVGGASGGGWQPIRGTLGRVAELSYIGLDIKGESQPSWWVMQCQWELR